jgi:hypothetical protein
MEENHWLSGSLLDILQANPIDVGGLKSLHSVPIEST